MMKPEEYAFFYAELGKKAQSQTAVKSIYYERKQVAEKSNVEGLERVLEEHFSLPVTEDDNGYAFFEVKFTSAPVSRITEEIEIAQVKETGLSCYRYVFISRSGFEEPATGEIRQIELGEMYEQ